MKPTMYLWLCISAEKITSCASLVEGVNYAHDLCDRSRAVLNGSTTIPEALKGKHLTFGTGLWTPMYLRENPKKEGEYIGLETDLLEELAKRASFTYDVRLVNWSSYDTWSLGLQDNIFRYDMMTTSYWTMTPSRMLMGAYSPYGYHDASTVFVSSYSITKIQKDESQWKIWFQFAAPFTEIVWIAIVCIVLVTGALYWLMEGGRNDDEFGDDSFLSLSAVAKSVTNAVLQLTGGGGFAPQTWPGRILLASWSWCIVLLLSAYTANLASFLVAKAEAGVQFESLEQAMKKNKIVCVGKGSATSEWFDQTYPGYPNLKQMTGNAKVYAKAIAEKKCDGALLSRDQFTELSQMSDVDNRCDLHIVGLPLTTQGAGFMVSNDYSHKCTILVRDVLAFYFTTMAADGTLQRMKQTALDMMAPACPKEAVEEEAEDAGQLDFESMFGILLMHILGITVAVLLFVATRIWEKFGNKSVVIKDHEDSNVDLPQQSTGNMQQQLSHILSELQFLKEHVEHRV